MDYRYFQSAIYTNNNWIWNGFICRWKENRQKLRRNDGRHLRAQTSTFQNNRNKHYHFRYELFIYIQCI